MCSMQGYIEYLSNIGAHQVFKWNKAELRWATPSDDFEDEEFAYVEQVCFLIFAQMLLVRLDFDSI